MNTAGLTTLTLTEFLDALRHPSALIEIAVALGCLLLAWAVVRVLRGKPAADGAMVTATQPSIWFGRRIVDGVLFPTLALALAFAARRIMLGLGMPLAVFKIVVPVLMSFALIRLSVRVLSVAFPTSRLVRAAERTISWVAWLAVVGWITGVLPQLLEELDQIRWKLGGSEVSVRNLLDGLLSGGFVLVLTLWVSAAIEARLLAGAIGEQLSLRKAAANIVRSLLIFVGLLVALSAVGIDLTALSVLGGGLGVGLGFGLQKLAANYVSGFVILAERSLRIGDMVKVDNFEGRITDIATRYTVIRALNGREAIVPNELLITQRVENASLADSRVAMSTLVQVAYGTNLDMLMPQLEAEVREVPRVLSDPGPAVQLSNFAADGLELTVVFWIADPENGAGGVRSAVNLQLWRTLEKLGVEIPFPQRVVHQAASAALPDGAMLQQLPQRGRP
ncbi:MAG TPA: mechanosensitive ion channel domain-containing protein [Ideonella sp.]|uniref:mechanosensitive ion channel family protein n=1 Tax=Ideonella sp. TaxID=1929293 RepID=UPI002BBF8965|nr:mechanosensitive ion channel domain-containing protein [Ideonella sp.]HSI47422.1 mechanosensitive ion channel domain-containing protein [Ideonella sp.]